MSDGKNLAAQCAILCTNAQFRDYLKERMTHVGGLAGEAWRMVTTKGDAAIAVRYLLDVDSRGELNSDDAAERRWQILFADFKHWKDEDTDPAAAG